MGGAEVPAEVGAAGTVPGVFVEAGGVSGAQPATISTAVMIPMSFDFGWFMIA